MINNNQIAVIVPVFNRADNIIKLSSSFKKIENKIFKVIIVDDCSNDNTRSNVFEYFEEAVYLKTTGNAWWSGTVNIGLEYALNNGYSYCLTFNDDQDFNSDFIDQLLDQANLNPKCIITSLILSSKDNPTIVSAGVLFDPKTKTSKANERISNCDIDYAAGYSLFIPSTALREAGLFRSEVFPQIYMEHDFIIKAVKCGYGVRLAYESIVYNDRSDKTQDPINTYNPLKRFSWAVKSPKSHLSFMQNLNYRILLNGVYKTSFILEAATWMRYSLKVILFSIFSKNQRQFLKVLLNFDKNKWA